MIRGLRLEQVQTLWRGWHLPIALQLFLVAAALRVLSFLVFYFVSLLTGHNGQVDSTDPVWYDRWAWYVAEHLRQGQWVDIRPYDLAGTYDVGFQYWVGLQYAIVGHYPEVPRLTNGLLAAFTAPALYLAARTTILGEVTATRAGWLAAIWPLSIFWAGYDLVKDPLAWFLLSVFILAICAPSARRLVALGPSAVAALLLVRSYVGTGLLLLLPLTAILKRAWAALVAIIIVLGAVEIVLVSIGQPATWSAVPYRGNGLPFITTSGPFAPSHGSVTDIVGRATGDSSGSGTEKLEGGSDATSIFKQPPRLIAKRLAVGLAVTLFGPRPAWKDIAHPTVYTGLYPGLLVWILLIPFAALGAWRALASRDPTMLSVTILAVGLWVGLSFVYAGVFRQREMAFPPTMMLIAWGLQRPWPRRWNLIYGSFFTIGFAALAAREIYTLLV